MLGRSTRDAEPMSHVFGESDPIPGERERDQWARA